VATAQRARARAERDHARVEAALEQEMVDSEVRATTRAIRLHNERVARAEGS
jgi:hypothetical protein